MKFVNCVEENVFYNLDITKNMIVLLIINVINYVVTKNVKKTNINVINYMVILMNIFVKK